MSTEQPVAESGASIESRLSAVFAAEDTPVQPEAAKDESSPVESDVGAEPETTDQSPPEEEAAPAEEYIDWQADDGSQVKVPAVLKDSLLRQQDYTKKTQLVAELQKQADDKLQYAQAREQLTAAVLDDVTELRTLQSQLKQYQDADWAAIYTADPGRALQAQQQMRTLEQQVQQKQAIIQQKAAHLQQASQKHNEFQWQKAEEGALKILGTVSPQENAAMVQTLKSLAIGEQEFKSRFADPRLIALAHKAAKWDMLQASKPGAVATAQKAPPVVKPGASKGPGVAAEQKYRDMRQSLRKSGSVQDAAKLIMMRMK